MASLAMPARLPRVPIVCPTGLLPPPPLLVTVWVLPCDGIPGFGASGTKLMLMSGVRSTFDSGTSDPGNPKSPPPGTTSPPDTTAPPGARCGIAPPRALLSGLPNRSNPALPPTDATSEAFIGEPLLNASGNAPFWPNSMPAVPAAPSKPPATWLNGDGPGEVVEAVPPAAFDSCPVRPPSHAAVWKG